MYPVSIIEKRERNEVLPGIVFSGRKIIQLENKKSKKGIRLTPTLINIILTVVVLITIVFLYAMPFVAMNKQDQDTYLQLALMPSSVPNQQSLLSTLEAVGVSVSVSNFDSNISIVTVTGFSDTRSLLSTVETFEGVLAVQNSVNGFQIKVVRGVL